MHFVFCQMRKQEITLWASKERIPVSAARWTSLNRDSTVRGELNEKNGKVSRKLHNRKSRDVAYRDEEQRRNIRHAR